MFDTLLTGDLHVPFMTNIRRLEGLVEMGSELYTVKGDHMDNQSFKNRFQKGLLF